MIVIHNAELDSNREILRRSLMMMRVGLGWWLRGRAIQNAPTNFEVAGASSRRGLRERRTPLELGGPLIAGR